ncbi:hypothetical protein MN116_002809 [Schistosoma mekongi]|uniref:Coiled-coil domain-containing protein n=1 Tax=Schistosoma mekongi TaxID=38744 RepID=A0AAE2D6W9_SCHME|nr:hypothetical protein MN116_002809 [Schistosoma mekongi]
MIPNQPPSTSVVTDISHSILSNPSADFFPDTQQTNSSLVELATVDSRVNPVNVQISESCVIEAISPIPIDETTTYQPSTDISCEVLSLVSRTDDTNSIPELPQEVSENVGTCQPNHLPSDTNLETNALHQSDNLLLHKQIDALTCKLLASQDQIERLLEEKRFWIENMHNSTGGKESSHLVTPGELRGRWMQAKYLAEIHKREKEAMVIKYAQSEQKRIQLEQQIHSLECKMGRLVNSNNLEQHHETTENGQTIDTDKSSVKKQHSKVSVVTSLIEKNDSDEKSNIEHLQKDLALAREQIDSLVKKQSADESRITTLMSKLSQVQESLKSEQKKSSSLNENLNRANKSLECALKQAKEAERLREREAERLCSEVALQEAQTSLRHLKNENDTIKQQLKELENVKSYYEKSQSRIDELTSELSSANDLSLELQSCKRRIDQLSDFTRRLTERHANLQAEHLVTLNALEETKNLLTEKGEEIVQLNEKHDNERKESERKLSILQCEYNDLSEKLNQLNDSEKWLKNQLKEEKERATAIHKRDAARIKDIAREVTRLSHHKKNQSDCCGPTNSCSSDLENELSSPNSSLKSLDLTQVATEPCDEKVMNPVLTTEMKITSTNRSDFLLSPSSINNDYNNGEPRIDDMPSYFKCSERIALLEKIDRLQRSHVNLTDKIEFFQEHCYQLTEELNKKSKIIQSLLKSSPNSFIYDNNHNKKTLSVNHKYNSIISSLAGGSMKAKTPYIGSRLDDNGQKLQNLLEDTIFKNITLKESLIKLNLEISSLRLAHERILNTLCHPCKLTVEKLMRTPTKSSIQSHEHEKHSNGPSSTHEKSEPPIFQNGGISA